MKIVRAAKVAIRQTASGECWRRVRVFKWASASLFHNGRLRCFLFTSGPFTFNGLWIFGAKSRRRFRNQNANADVKANDLLKKRGYKGDCLKP